VASCASPVVFSIVAFLTIFVFGHIFLTVFTVPIGLSVVALRAILVRSYLEVTISAFPTHGK